MAGASVLRDIRIEDGGSGLEARQPTSVLSRLEECLFGNTVIVGERDS